MAAGEEAATAFVETSLGTRLAVSFPASATTVAHLKRIVSDEHAASFPHIGHITVESFKVRRRGSWYHLTDSMPVRAAFHGIKGAWHLQAHVLPHSAPPSSSDVDMLHPVLCSQPNAIDNTAVSQGALLSGTPPTDQEGGHDHLADDSALTPHLKHINVQGGGYAVRGEDSDPDVVAAPRERKRFREQDGDHDQSMSIPVKCDEDQNKCTQSSMSRRICAPGDGLLNKVDANSIRGSGDVMVLSSDDEMLRDGCGLDENSSYHDEGLDFVEKKDEEVVSTRPTDQAEPSVELCDHEAKSITNDKESKLGFSVNENDYATDTEKHANEAMSKEKLVEQQDHFDNGEEYNSENPPLCFSMNQNDCATATEKYVDEGVARGKLVELQDYLNKGAKELYKSNDTEALQNWNSKDTSSLHPEYASDCHQYDGSSRSFDSKCCKRSRCEIVIGQVGDHDRVCSEVERAPWGMHDKSVKRCGSVSATVGGFFDHLTPTPNSELSEKKVNSTDQDYHRSDPLLHGSNESARSLGKMPFCGQKEPSMAEVYNNASRMKGKDLPPCAEFMKEGNSSEQEAVSRKVTGKEPWTAKVCDGERSSKGTDRQPCVEKLKEGNYSEKEGVAHEEKQIPRIVTLVDVDGTKWTIQLDDSERPPCNKSTKEGSSSEKEEMSHKVKEEEPWIARMCNGERSSSKGTDCPPCAGSMRGGNSSEKEGVAHEENQSTKSVTLVDVDGTKWTMQLDDSEEIISILEANRSQRDLARPSQNAEGCPEGTPENKRTRVPLDHVSEKNDPSRHGSFETPASSGSTGWKHAGGTSADGTEQGAWDGRRRPRQVVRKIPNSRAAKIYGYR